MACLFENLGRWGDILPVPLQMAKHTTPDPVRGLDHPLADPIAASIRVTDPQWRMGAFSLLHHPLARAGEQYLVDQVADMARVVALCGPAAAVEMIGKGDIGHSVRFPLRESAPPRQSMASQ